jgi:hypothetical protein
MLPASSSLEAAADDDFDAPSWSRTPSPPTCPATEITTNVVVLGMHTTPLLLPSVLEASSLSERIEPNADPIPFVAASGSALGASVCDAPGVDVCEPHATSCPATLNPVAQPAGFSSLAHAGPPFSLDPATGAEALPPIGPLLNVGLPPQPGAEALPPIGPLLNVGPPPQPGALAHGPSSLSNPHAQACGPGLDAGAAATHQHALICPGLGSQRSRTIGLCPSTALPVAVSTSACQLACTNPPPKTEASTCLHLPPNDRSHASGASLVEGEPLADHYPPAGCTDSPADASPIGLEEAIVHLSGPPTSTSPTQHHPQPWCMPLHNPP